MSKQTIDTYKLTGAEEPSDEVLSQLMREAAAIAKKFGIRVYTIGLGTDGKDAQGHLVGDIDYKTLQNIAIQTDGEFYRAQSRNELSQIYKDIDKLEKTRLDAKSYGRRYEAYMPFAMLALLVFFVEIVLRITVFKRIP